MNLDVMISKLIYFQREAKMNAKLNINKALHIAHSTAFHMYLPCLPFSVVINNPLTTDDKCTPHATLTACYQMAQSVLSALAEKVGQGEVGRCHPERVTVHGSCCCWL